MSRPGGICRGQTQHTHNFRRHRHTGGRVPRRHRPASGREHQRGLDGGRRRLHLCDRLSVLRPLPGQQGVEAGRRASDAGHAPQRRARLCADAPQRPVRPPLRRHRRRGAAGRAGAGRPDGLSARRAVDPGRRGSSGGRAGHDRPVHVHTPRRQVAGRHDPHRDGHHPRHHRPGRRADDHGHHPGRSGPGRGQGPGREPMGHLHRRRHHPHRHLHGPVHPLSAARPRGRDFGHRRRPADPGHHRRGPCRGRPVLGPGLHPDRPDPGYPDDGLWLHRLGHSGLAVAGAA